MIEFEVNGVQYRANAMDARRQFHVARRISSVLSPSAEAIGKLKNNTDTKASFVAAIDGFFDALSTMPDEQLDYVLDACLDTVSRKDGSQWSQIRRGGTMMYELDLYTQGAIVYHVVKGNLDGFFASLPAGTGDAIKMVLSQAAAQAMTQPSGD